MKKMICEICGSSKIKKENGIFICKECGTEYSLLDAKNLIKEVEEIDEKKEEEIVIEEGTSVLPSDFPVEYEATTEDKIMKLKYDLLCWYRFFEKCHELEHSIFISDQGANSNVDITVRKLNWDYNTYFETKLHGEFDKYYLRKYGKKLKDEHQANEKRKRNCNIESKNKIKALDKRQSIIAIKCIVVYLFIHAILALISLYTLFLIPISIPIGNKIIYYFWDRIIAQKKAEELKIEKEETFEEYWIRHKQSSDTYKKLLKEKYDEFLKRAKKSVEYLVSNIPQLIEIKNQLIESVPLPPSYSNEQSVKGLLTLVLNGRAHTLKEAINLLETEYYREAVLNSFRELNYNLSLLVESIERLNYKMNSISNKLSSHYFSLYNQNSIISSQLMSIKYDTSFIAIDNLFD